IGNVALVFARAMGDRLHDSDAESHDPIPSFALRGLHSLALNRSAQRSTTFQPEPEFAPDRGDKAIEFARVMGERRGGAPDRLRPPGVAGAARGHVDMQLRYEAAECPHLWLVGMAHRLE